MMMKKFHFDKHFLLGLGIVFFYLFTHLFNLTILPIFADESIYIRWSQLIIDEPARYLFFPLNDGKTPLQMWLITPLQLIFSDPLFAGRFLSVIFGLVQVFAIGWLVKLLGGRKKTILLSMLLTSILPFWFFHHRMALTDPPLALFITLYLIGLIKIVTNPTKIKSLSISHLLQKALENKVWISFAGISLGLAFWSKLPALLFIPAGILTVFLKQKFELKQFIFDLFQIGWATLLGLLIFISLKLNPAFGQLFSRGSDFLYPVSEILAGQWQTTIFNIPSYINYFIQYLTLPVILLMLYGLFSPKMKKQQRWLFLSFLSFFLPIAIMGKVVYPRYFFPIGIFLTASASLAIQEINDLYISKAKSIIKKTIFSLILASLLANIILSSTNFILLSLLEPDRTPFVSADTTQYLTEWSSGHGVKQAVQYIQTQAQDHSIAVATEGYFGTLPDAVLMYLHGENVDNIYVEGIGQPVLEIPDKFATRAKDFDQVILLVNSHRMDLKLDDSKLISEYCRPFEAPCLQVWDISEMIKN